MSSYQPFPGNLEEALELAHKSELLAKHHYKIVAQLSVTADVVEMSERFALMEEGHAKAIEQIFKQITGKEFRPSAGSDHNEAYAVTFESLDALLKDALEKEKDSYLFYISLSNSIKDQNVKDILRRLADEEKEHQEAIKKLF
ncbi:MAG: ferritin family protein [Firmicutes bacterium]|nr:ferritin family protein [Bacillota bacterium]